MNSTALVDLVSQGARVIDVGSGAGLPGIPLAIARPDLQIVLVDSLMRRVDFLTGVVDELGLGDRVSVWRERAERLEGSFDVVTARAVARLDKLVGWTRRLFVPDGELLAIKGATAQDEIDGAAQVLKKFRMNAELLEVLVPDSTEPTYVVRVRQL